jgi:uncharacterized protein (DUF983 family)
MPVKTYTSALLQGKCPQCRVGDIFKFPLIKIRHFSEMHVNCPNCDLRFEREPGFFYGAMFVSYALAVAIIVAVSIALNVLISPDTFDYIFSISIVLLLNLPVMFRASRVIFLYLFGGVKYRPDI